MPFRIFFRIGNDSSFGILAGGLFARLRTAVFLRKFRPDYPVLPNLFFHEPYMKAMSTHNYFVNC